MGPGAARDLEVINGLHTRSVAPSSSNYNADEAIYLEPDILSFPISLLSAAAVSEAIMDVLLHQKVRKQWHLLREEEAEDVLLDIQSVLEIGEVGFRQSSLSFLLTRTQMEMLECRRWIVGVKRDWCML